MDVDPLFTNIPHEETIKFYVIATHSYFDVFEVTYEPEIKELSCLATKESGSL